MPLAQQTSRASLLARVCPPGSSFVEVALFCGHRCRIAAYNLTAEGGFQKVWEVEQWTNANTLIIGEPDSRTYVATNVTDVKGLPTPWNLESFVGERLIFRCG